MAFDFISPASAKQVAYYKSIYGMEGLPEPYCNPGPLSDHLNNAVFWFSIEFNAKNHFNAVKGPLKCVCYYTDADSTPNAECRAEKGTYFITVNMFLVRHLVMIAHHIGRILDKRPRAGKPYDETILSSIKPDRELFKLLVMEQAIPHKDVEEVVKQWPEAFTEGAQIDLAEFAIFYDLLRLIWVHEWAHAVCGHVAFAEERMGLLAYPEFSEARSTATVITGIAYPANEVTQALEMHADEFSIRYNIEKILWGSEPVIVMAGPTIDLVDRIVMLNIAFCIFCIWGELVEQKLFPGISFQPRHGQAINGNNYKIFSVFPISHPPAALRYLRFRDFQREAAMGYNIQLHLSVDPLSFEVVKVLAALCGWFDRLLNITPLVVQTPGMKQLIAYETHLLEIGETLTPHLLQLNYTPMMDKGRED